MRASLSQRGYQTNAAGVVVPLFAITNLGPQRFIVVAGTEKAKYSYDFTGSLPEVLEPGKELLLPIPLANSTPGSRAMVACEKIYADSFWPKNIRQYVDLHFLKICPVDIVRAGEFTK